MKEPIFGRMVSREEKKKKTQLKNTLLFLNLLPKKNSKTHIFSPFLAFSSLSELEKREFVIS